MTARVPAGGGPSRRRAAAAAALALACGGASAGAPDDGAAVQAPDDAASAPRHRWLVGAALSQAPSYAGAGERETRLRPFWAWEYGRFRISTSHASALLRFGDEAAPGSGASAELLRRGPVRLGVALRIDNGRSSSDAEALRGLPEVRRTLRGRLYVSYALAPAWSVSASVSQDLLGRGGGAVGGLELGYRRRLTPDTVFTGGVGLTLADGRYMRSYFGVDEAAAQRSGYAVSRPSAGLRDVHAGLGLTTALTPSWLVFANVGASTLVGDAADSPLTQQRSSWQAGVGLAYRCCR